MKSNWDPIRLGVLHALIFRQSLSPAETSKELKEGIFLVITLDRCPRNPRQRPRFPTANDRPSVNIDDRGHQAYRRGCYADADNFMPDLQAVQAPKREARLPNFCPQNTF